MAIKYIINHNGHWAVKNANAKKVSKTFDTQEEAIKYAKSLNDCTAIKIQSKDGSFRKA